MLIYNDLYEYDFTSCYYNLLKNIGWEMDDIDPNNKKQRNIKIGLLQKNNKYIGEYLQNTVENLIDFYINENNLDKKEILLRKEEEDKRQRRSKILLIIKQKKEVTIKDISSSIKDCSEKTIQRELNSLLSEKVIKKTGERRWSKYLLA